MNRRQALNATLTAATVAAVFRPRRVATQGAGTRTQGTTSDTLYLNPGTGGDANPGTSLCHDLYGSAIWTASVSNTLDYRNNVVANCNYVWTAQGGASAVADAGGRGGRPAAPAPATPQQPVRYKVVDSYFANNRRLAGSGTGARLEYQDIDPSFLEIVDTKVSEQALSLERDQAKRRYLHPIAGSDAAKIGAGLFTLSRG